MDLSLESINKAIVDIRNDERSLLVWSSDGYELTELGVQFGGPFEIITESRPLIILPPEAIDAVNAEKKLSFVEFVREEHLSNFDTFRTMRPFPTSMFNEAVLKGITRNLHKFTKPMNMQMTACLNKNWGQQSQWQEVLVMDNVLDWVTRLSNIVFLGDRFGKNEEWLELTSSFTVNMFTALGQTKLYHPLLRPVADTFAPLNRQVRKQQDAIEAILRPAMDARHEEIRAAKREGRKPNLPDDSIEWFRNAANGRDYPEVWIQLGLAQVAIQTTSDQLSQAILNLCLYPEFVEPLRQEAIEVLRQHGMVKQTLVKLELLDSYLKESQRLKPVSLASMHRRAMANVELTGGIRIREGEHLAISNHCMWDEKNYPNPEKFDLYRFIERKKLPGYEARSSFVTTSPDHLGFAHGKYACPGRFLAGNMMKIALLHLLLKYDMKIDNPDEATWWYHGTDINVKMGAKLWMKSRKPEIDLDAMTFEL
ncbi:hypothetical protein FGRMN_10017 [Fusarium graminum]|nr:hypothetical protein FGRMN_10017 [Fusarium graminum]